MSSCKVCRGPAALHPAIQHCESLLPLLGGEHDPVCAGAQSLKLLWLIQKPKGLAVKNDVVAVSAIVFHREQLLIPIL